MNKDEKKREKDAERMKKYGLLTDDPRDLHSLEEIEGSLGIQKVYGSDSIRHGNYHGGYLDALIQQNWIIIRYLDKINRKLDRLMKKEDKNVGSKQ